MTAPTKLLSELVREAHELVCCYDNYPHPECKCLAADCCLMHDSITALAAYAEAAEKRAVELEREVGRLRGVIVMALEDFEAPCGVCGYNGPGFYQPDTHPCAALRKEG